MSNACYAVTIISEKKAYTDIKIPSDINKLIILNK